MSSEPVQSKMLMPFGKHYGKPLHQLPSDYFYWLCSLNSLPKELKAELQKLKYDYECFDPDGSEMEVWPQEY